MENQLFDVDTFLLDAGFKEQYSKEYSLFDRADGGLLKDPVESSVKSKVFFNKDEISPRDAPINKFFNKEEYDAQMEALLDMESLENEVSPYELTTSELQWLNKSEEEIKSRIFELAEEIQRESMMYNKMKDERQSMSSSRDSESDGPIMKLSPSRNALTSDSVSEFDRVSEFDLKWCSTPIQGPQDTKFYGTSFGPDNSPESADRDTSPLSSYLGSNCGQSNGRREAEMPFLSLDGKPTGYGDPRDDKLREFRRGFRSRSSNSVSSQSSDGLVDWRVAARSGEQNRCRSTYCRNTVENKYEDRNNDISGAKRRLCRHFLKGFCNRGDTCDFLHDNSIFCPDEQKVFLGGLPTHITVDSLVALLKEMNYNVINKPKILRGFTPQVCLSTIQEAQELIRKKKIYLDNTPVDVRPYEDRKPPGSSRRDDDLKRSIFLGGLSADTTVEHIKDDLERAGYPVENNPILKAGFVPQVVLESVEKAQDLIKLAKIKINGKFADVRPYVNFRKRY